MYVHVKHVMKQKIWELVELNFKYYLTYKCKV